MTETCDNCKFPIKTSACERGCSHRWHCDCARSSPDEDHEPTIAYHVDGYGISDHAIQRYRERSMNKPPSVAITEAWESAVPVGMPHSGGVTARLYPPEQTVFVAHGGVVRTALRPDYQTVDLNTDHLKECGHCEQLWYPADDDGCPWCDGPSPAKRSVKGLTIDGGRYDG